MSIQTLQREAMGTIFSLRLSHERGSYARQAASAALEELDRLESLLSRYVENSDLSRINRSPVRASLIVAVETFECLQIALDMERRTGGAFNVAYGSQSPTSARQAIELWPAPCRVHVRAEGVRLDLGGIGKGFAIDHMATLLADWEISSAFLCSRASTFLATGSAPGDTGWKIRFGPEASMTEMPLLHRAISGSGNSVKGAHIFDPSDGRAVTTQRATWATSRRAAHADAVSTALMVMSPTEIEAFIERESDMGVFVTAEDGQSWRYSRPQETRNSGTQT